MKFSMKALNPVHYYFGYPMRWIPFQVHHLWIGLVGCVISLYGLWTAIDMSLYAYVHNMPLESILGAFVAILQVLAFLIWGYVVRDDILQHHEQVENPEYHSPVHEWYGKTLYQYPLVRWINIKVDNFVNKMRG